MSKLLPDSGITTMVRDNTVYAFVQDYEGSIVQYGGSVDSASAYVRDKRNTRIVAEREVTPAGVAQAGNPKMFTPIAAVTFIRALNASQTESYVIYLDDNNILCDQHQSSPSNNYQDGTLSTLKVKAAAYSSLAAVTVPGKYANFIGVFYQDPGPEAAVKMISFNGYMGKWETGPARLLDPPLFGTSITAVKPRPGLIGRLDPAVAKENENQPIYYLQLDDNKLANGQGQSEPLPVSLDRESSGLPMVFSPHTSLTAVDDIDSKKLHLVYKSHSGKIKTCIIDSNGVKGQPEQICGDITVAPRSAIAACLAPKNGNANTRIVFFYQALQTSTRQVKLTARVGYKNALAGANIPWQSSPDVYF